MPIWLFQYLLDALCEFAIRTVVRDFQIPISHIEKFSIQDTAANDREVVIHGPASRDFRRLGGVCLIFTPLLAVSLRKGGFICPTQNSHVADSNVETSWVSCSCQMTLLLRFVNKRNPSCGILRYGTTQLRGRGSGLASSRKVSMSICMNRPADERTHTTGLTWALKKSTSPLPCLHARRA